MKSGWELQSFTTEKEFLCREHQREKREEQEAKEKYRPALAAEREAVWVGASVRLWVDIHIHSKKSICIGLSMVSSRGILVTVSVRAGLDLQCCSQGSAFCAHFSHLWFCLGFIPWTIYCVHYKHFLCIFCMFVLNGKTPGWNVWGAMLAGPEQESWIYDLPWPCHVCSFTAVVIVWRKRMQGYYWDNIQ